jgi:hypothetical protein
VLIVFVAFAIHFYHSLVVQKCETSVQDIEQLENMKRDLDTATVKVNMFWRVLDTPLWIANSLHSDGEYHRQKKRRWAIRPSMESLHHQPFHVPTAGAQPFLWIFHKKNGCNPPRGPGARWWESLTGNKRIAPHLLYEARFFLPRTISYIYGILPKLIVITDSSW